MSFWKWSAAALMMMLFVGCGDSTGTADAPTDEGAPAVASEENSEESASTSDGDTAAEVASNDDAADKSDASPVPDESADDAAPATESPYIAMPEGTNPRLVQAYSQVTKAAEAGGTEALLNLAGISQQAAGMLAKDHPETAYPLYKQAAKALREAMPKYEGDLPGSFVGGVFYNEACALSQGGDVDGAMASLEEAITSGFSDMEQLRSDSDLEPVRALEGFDEKLKAWEVMAIEKITAHAKEELAKGETFPFEFTLTDLEGTERSLADYKGKVVIVDIWGTWCPPCREEIPSFIKLQDSLGEKGFQIVGLNYERGKDDEENLKLATAYAKKEGINYPCLMGDEATRDQVPNFRGFPTTLFIDKAGKVRMKAVGLHEYAFLEAVVNELLAEETPAAETSADGADAKAKDAKAADTEEKSTEAK